MLKYPEQYRIAIQILESNMLPAILIFLACSIKDQSDCKIVTVYSSALTMNSCTATQAAIPYEVAWLKKNPGYQIGGAGWICALKPGEPV